VEVGISVVFLSLLETRMVRFFLCDFFKRNGTWKVTGLLLWRTGSYGIVYY